MLGINFLFYKFYTDFTFRGYTFYICALKSKIRENGCGIKPVLQKKLMCNVKKGLRNDYF